MIGMRGEMKGSKNKRKFIENIDSGNLFLLIRCFLI
jgi:hypothetical protein